MTGVPAFMDPPVLKPPFIGYGFLEHSAEPLFQQLLLRIDLRKPSAAWQRCYPRSKIGHRKRRWWPCWLAEFWDMTKDVDLSDDLSMVETDPLKYLKLASKGWCQKLMSWSWSPKKWPLTKKKMLFFPAKMINRNPFPLFYPLNSNIQYRSIGCIQWDDRHVFFQVGFRRKNY